MDQRLKERLVGAAVLVALAVWLIPWVLDGRAPPAEQEVVPLELPAPADGDAPLRTQTIDLGAVRESAAPVLASSDASPSDRRTAAPRREAPEHAAAPAPPQPAAPRAADAAGSGGPQWMVQLGSFSDEENARRLVARVADIGFEAKISMHKSGDRVLHRVRVGPESSRNAAEAKASALSAHGFVANVVPAD